jgi:hypothetical protein
MPLFRKSIASLSLAAITAIAGGCTSDHKPDDYHHQRPDVTDVDSRDRGLQSSEVVEASEKLTAELLALPEVNQSPRRLTIVFTNLEDLTHTRQFNYDIFLERLKTEMSYKGRDRIAFVTNKDKYYGTRSRELDGVRGERDDRGPAPTNRVQPDFALTGKVMELPNRGTDYYLFTYSLTDIRGDGGTEIPLRYEVRVRR